MKRKTARFAALMILFALTLSAAVFPAAGTDAAMAAEGLTITRLSGADRLLTSYAVADAVIAAAGYAYK